MRKTNFHPGMKLRISDWNASAPTTEPLPDKASFPIPPYYCTSGTLIWSPALRRPPKSCAVRSRLVTPPHQGRSHAEWIYDKIRCCRVWLSGWCTGIPVTDPEFDSLGGSRSFSFTLIYFGLCKLNIFHHQVN